MSAVQAKNTFTRMCIVRLLITLYKYRTLIAVVIFAVLFIAGIYYAVWQYNLCMELIGNTWYCLQHASG